jgi:hypothetical protein
VLKCNNPENHKFCLHHHTNLKSHDKGYSKVHIGKHLFDKFPFQNGLKQENASQFLL